MTLSPSLVSSAVREIHKQSCDYFCFLRLLYVLPWWHWYFASKFSYYVTMINVAKHRWPQEGGSPCDVSNSLVRTEKYSLYPVWPSKLGLWQPWGQPLLGTESASTFLLTLHPWNLNICCLSFLSAMLFLRTTWFDQDSQVLGSGHPSIPSWLQTHPLLGSAVSLEWCTLP